MLRGSPQGCSPLPPCLPPGAAAALPPPGSWHQWVCGQGCCLECGIVNVYKGRTHTAQNRPRRRERRPLHALGLGFFLSPLSHWPRSPRAACFSTTLLSYLLMPRGSLRMPHTAPWWDPSSTPGSAGSHVGWEAPEVRGSSRLSPIWEIWAWIKARCDRGEDTVPDLGGVFRSKEDLEKI